jgi:hypothetical protein
MIMSSLHPVFRRVRTLARYWHPRYLLLLVGLLVLLLCAGEFRDHRFDLSRWDTMLISGLAAYIIAVRLAFEIPGKMEQTLVRLVKRGALVSEPKQLEDFKVDLEDRANRWARRGGLIVGGALLVAFLAAYRLSPPLDLTILEVFLGYVAGYYLGRMAAYGGLGRILKREGISLKVQPGHLDGAAGLKPIGDFYFFQAMLVAIPALYLAVWWLIIPLLPGDGGMYIHWRDSYLGLLAIALTFEILSFFVPLWSFHREMQVQKVRWQEEADELSRQVARVQADLARSETVQQRNELKEQLSYMTQRYWDIEQLPTWPLDTKTRRRFTLNNLALFLPLLSEFIGVTGAWQLALKLATGLFKAFPE